MFNLFKKSENSDVAIAEQNKSSYPKIVDEIHNEFYSAGENILQEATSLLKELEQKDLVKGERLAALGFGKTREAVSAIETKRKLASTREMAEMVMYYKTNYPNNKFITDEQIKTICEKYGLVFGDISMYKGFVPESKLAFIEGFKLKEKDQNSFWFEITESLNGADAKLPLSFISEKDLSADGLDYFNRNPDASSFYIRGHGGISHYTMCKKEIYDQFDGLQFVKATKADKRLKICAPMKDMEIPKGKELVGHKIQDIPDPVVLQPVNGGALIICAWGDEATDEIIVNQEMN
jgi:hypothetical protein